MNTFSRILTLTVLVMSTKNFCDFPIKGITTFVDLQALTACTQGGTLNQYGQETLSKIAKINDLAHVRQQIQELREARKNTLNECSTLREEGGKYIDKQPCACYVRYLEKQLAMMHDVEEVLVEQQKAASAQ